MGNGPEDGDEEEHQVPIGEQEHNTEGGVEPLSLEMIQNRSEKAAGYGGIAHTSAVVCQWSSLVHYLVPGEAIREKELTSRHQEEVAY